MYESISQVRRVKDFVIPEHMKPCMHILDLPKLKKFLTLKVNFLCQKLSKSFIKEYQFRGTYLVIGIF